jgi:hypothetical protein
MDGERRVICFAAPYTEIQLIVEDLIVSDGLPGSKHQEQTLRSNDCQEIYYDHGRIESNSISAAIRLTS